MNWLPSQVALGYDTSNPDPRQWKAFGTDAEKVAQASKHAVPKPTFTTEK